MLIEFYKYHGTGNDFVILDNRQGKYGQLSEKEINLLCHRHFGIGADGLMFLNTKAGYDFEMKYFNSDGTESSMCGNGGRCLVKFAYDLGLHKSMFRFLAIDGEHKAEVDLPLIKLKMNDVNDIQTRFNSFVLNTGSPHYVKYVSDIKGHDVINLGREIRNSKDFAEKGINVNFVETLSSDEIYVRTYERGVEDETMSCGTGVTAAAIISAHNEIGFNRVEVQTPGGHLSVEYDKLGEEKFENIWLCGPAIMVFKGQVEINEQMMRPLEKLRAKAITNNSE